MTMSQLAREVSALKTKTHQYLPLFLILPPLPRYYPTEEGLGQLELQWKPTSAGVEPSEPAPRVLAPDHLHRCTLCVLRLISCCQGKAWQHLCQLIHETVCSPPITGGCGCPSAHSTLSLSLSDSFPPSHPLSLLCERSLSLSLCSVCTDLTFRGPAEFACALFIGPHLSVAL